MQDNAGDSDHDCDGDGYHVCDGAHDSDVNDYDRNKDMDNAENKVENIFIIFVVLDKRFIVSMEIF